jgi:hypothetical protein
MHAPDLETRRLKVWRDLDLLVVGSTTAAVSAALAAAAAGRRVGLVCDEMYLGRDLAGAFHLWGGDAGVADPLIAAAFATAGSDPARPAALKRALEQALVAAGIPFMFGVRPIGLMRSESGGIRGAVIAARTALFAVTCRGIIDATPRGLVARMAGVPLTARAEPELPARWRILAERAPAAWPGECRPLLPDLVQTLSDGPRSFCGFELSHAVPGRDPRASDHLMRALLVDESVWATADALIEEPREILTGQTVVSGPDALADSAFQAGSSLWVANGLLPLAGGALGGVPGILAGLGRRVGAIAAETVAATGGAVPGAYDLATGDGRASGSMFIDAFLRDDGGTVEVRGWKFPEWDGVDVLVAGGGTGGAPAAIAAARAGARTLCIEPGHGFGGVGTLGLISSYWFGNKVGFTAELNALVSEFDALSRSKKGNMWHPGVKSGLYHRLLRDAGGAGWLGSFVCGIRMDGSRPEAALVSTPFGCGLVPARCMIDATGNADLAAAAGASCRVMDARHAAVQGTGISPRVYPAVLHQNSDHTFVDENDPEGITAAHVQVRAKYPDNFDTMPFVNSRERRQIHGDLEVSPLDILAERRFPDTVFTASSNFDTHGFIVHPVFMVVPPDHKPLRADVPLRCMLARGIEGLLVTGLGMSAHRDALPVIRMQADVQNQGYAAGLLAAQVARTGESLRAVDVKIFQQQLVARGILSTETANDTDSFPLPDTDVAAAIAGDLANVKEVAILFAHAEAAREGLMRVMRDATDPARRENAALILGLMGIPEAAPHLAELLAARGWDEGWNYRGMGQFGESMSRVDALIVALGRCGAPADAAPLVRLCRALDADPAFSHCRALALAAAALRDPGLTRALAELSHRSGIAGHALTTLSEILTDTDDSTVSTRARNLSLRELYIARGLFASGDPGGRGRGMLERYARDLRGHFARHAQAVLEAGPDAPDARGLA